MNSKKLVYTYFTITAVFLQSILLTEALHTQVCTKQRPELRGKEIVGPDRFFYNFIYQYPMWVDRSLLIKKIWQNDKTISVISTPRRWGRTLNLQMLHAFFVISEQEYAQRNSINTTFAYNYFRNGILQDRMNNVLKIEPAPLISQYRDIIEEAQGQFPVIYVNFMGMASLQRMSDLHEHVKDIFGEYSFHIKMMTRNESLAMRKLALKCKKIEIVDTLTFEEILTSVQLLSELLHGYYGKKVIILIDQYDQFVRDTYFTYSTHRHQAEPDSTKDFYQKFTQHTLRSNKYVEKVIVTTVLPVTGALGFDSTDDLEEYNFIDGDDIYQFFGLSTVDVFNMTDIFGVEESREDVKKWYGGYTCGNSSSECIFSPNSVISFLYEDNGMQNYMVISRSVVFLFKLRRYPVFQNTLKSLIENGTCDIEYDKIKRLGHEHCNLINKFVTDERISEKEFRKEHCDIALAFLYGMSYVTVDATYANNGKNGTYIRLKVPNQEVREEIKYRLDPYLYPKKVQRKTTIEYPSYEES